jgi:PAS domain S-box-containing protein
MHQQVERFFKLLFHDFILYLKSDTMVKIDSCPDYPLEKILECQNIEKAVKIFLENAVQLSSAASLGFYSLPDKKLVAFKGAHPGEIEPLELQEHTFIKKGLKAAFLFTFGKPFGVFEVSWEVEPPLDELDSTEYICLQYAPLLGAVKRYETLSLHLEEEMSYRKKIEKVLQETREINSIMEENGIAFIQNGLFISVSQCFAEMTGYTCEELLNTPVPDYMNFSHLPDSESKSIYEGYLIHKDGHHLCVEFTTGKTTYHGIPCNFFIFRDSTERKEAEEQIRKSEKLYRDFFEHSPVGIYRSTPEGRFLMANVKLVTMLGYTSFEEMAKKDMGKEGFEAGYPRSVFKEKIEREGQVTGFESVWLRRDGTTLFFLENAHVVRDDAGNTLYYEGTVEDITERKEAEEQLRESEEKYRTIVELAPDGIMTVDLKGMITSCNTAFLRLTGYTREDIVGKHISRLPTLRMRDIPKFHQLFTSFLKAKFSTPLEFHWIHRDGTPRLGEVHATFIREKGSITGIQAVVRDITERKKAEEQLRESEEKYRTMVELAPDGIATVDLKGYITSCNTTFVDMSGYTREEIVGKHFTKLPTIHAQDIPQYMKILTSLIKGKVPGPFEVKWIHRDGTRRLGELHVSIMRKGHAIMGIQAIARDITERKRAEEMLRQSEEKYRTLVENLNVGVYRATPGKNGYFIDVNQAFVSMLGYDKKENFLKLRVSDIYSNPENRVEFSKKVSHQGFVKNEELYLKMKDGSSIIVSDTAVAVYDTDGTILYFDGISEDITQRKWVEEQIKASLREKEVLLQEIHHRVKNNMQIISSLLNLQSQYTGDSHVLEAFKESQNRIKSMALVHEKLYQSRDLAKIDISDYVRSLVGSLFQSYKTAAESITLKIEVEHVSLRIDYAVPCGLIINELVSNCLKHAFPAGRGGTIVIGLHPYEDKIELVVKDNGVGLPENVDLDDIKSLGLRLVTILAEDQLDGEISLDRRGGTEVRIRF